MMYSKRGAGEFLNISLFLFLTFAIVLTVFSIFYADWRYAKITGFQELEAVQPSGEVNCVVGGTCTYSSNPPAAVVEQISKDAEIVSQSADYASGIKDIIEKTPLTEEDLLRYKENLEDSLKSSDLIYVNSSKAISQYSSSELDKSHIAIIQSIDKIKDVLEEIDLIILDKVVVRQEKQHEQALWVLGRENVVAGSLKKLEEQVFGVIPSDSKISVQIIPPNLKTDNCQYPSYFSSFNDSLVDFGTNGIDLSSGRICDIKPTGIYPSVRMPLPIDEAPELDVTLPDVTPIIPKSPVVTALHFGDRGKSKSEGYHAAALFKDNNGLLNIRFFNSPNYYDVEQKISEFMNNLLFKGKDVDGLYLSGMSVQDAELIVKEHKFFPWALWIIFSVMVVSFVLFGRLLIPNHITKISKGKIALDKGNYPVALEIYNKLIRDYSPDGPARQDILDYFVLLKRKINNSELKFDQFTDSKSILKPVNFESPSNELERVKQMIYHALDEIKSSPKVAFARMPIIAEATKNLDSKDRRKIAPLYESLVYQLRDLRLN